MKEKLKYLDTYKMELPFKILYLIFAFFSFCNMTYGQPIMSVLVVIGRGNYSVSINENKRIFANQGNSISYLILRELYNIFSSKL